MKLIGCELAAGTTLVTGVATIITKGQVTFAQAQMKDHLWVLAGVALIFVALKAFDEIESHKTIFKKMQTAID